MSLSGDSPPTIRILAGLAVSNALDALLSVYPDTVRPEIEEGIPDLLRMAERLGLEVLQAEADGLTFAEAVRRPRDFPLMGRVHYGVIDIFQFELPTDLVAVFREMCRRARLLDASDLGRYMFAAAAVQDRSKDRAAMRFLIYECVRANAWALTFDSPHAEALGCFRDLDEVAEADLRKRLRAAAMFADDIRPIPILVAEAVEFLATEATARLACIKEAGTHELIFDALDTVLAQAKAAREMATPRAAVLRNHYAGDVGDEPVALIELADRQPLAFPSHGAAKQTSKRMNDETDRGQVMTHRRKRLIDIIREEMADKP